MLLDNCGCFSEKYLESLGVCQVYFVKKKMSKKGGALQEREFF